jgi:hypothetical protein
MRSALAGVLRLLLPGAGHLYVGRRRAAARGPPRGPIVAVVVVVLTGADRLQDRGHARRAASSGRPPHRHAAWRIAASTRPGGWSGRDWPSAPPRSRDRAGRDPPSSSGPLAPRATSRLCLRPGDTPTDDPGLTGDAGPSNDWFGPQRTPVEVGRSLVRCRPRRRLRPRHHEADGQRDRDAPGQVSRCPDGPGAVPMGQRWPLRPAPQLGYEIDRWSRRMDVMLGRDRRLERQGRDDRLPRNLLNAPFHPAPPTTR